jgi:ArsR family transcriptional regulator
MMVEVLKVAAEQNRFRPLALLAHGDSNVTDLSETLGISQPRISRHLKLTSNVGLLDRRKDGSEPICT